MSKKRILVLNIRVSCPIAFPIEGMYCAKTVIAADTGRLIGLAYEIFSSQIFGSVLFDSQGDFDFQSSTTSLGLNFVLKVTVGWSLVALATSYTLNYTTIGSLCSAKYGVMVENMTSRWTMTTLRNGLVYFAERAGGGAWGAEEMDTAMNVPCVGEE